LVIFLSIIIPMYNEQYRIIKTLEKIISYMSKKQINYELILVNDAFKMFLGLLKIKKIHANSIK